MLLLVSRTSTFRPVTKFSWIYTLESFRCFHVTSLACIRKKPVFVIKRTPEEEEKRNAVYQTFSKYAPSEEQTALIRETILVRSYLEKVQKELPRLKEYLPNEPYSPPPASHYLRFRYLDDLRKPDNPEATEVKLSISVPQLVETEKLTKEQTHLLLLLCQQHYNPLTNEINVSCQRHIYRAQNRKWLIDLIDRLLDHVKNAQDFFADVELNLNHVQRRIRDLKRVEKCRFPKSWLPPNPKVSKNISGSELKTSLSESVQIN
ncbi:37S ribosomal protein S24, mitochondrial [Coelomomyces lativittatus]|nr:37S ribosomal protein S24, mitochondrial [Coelomomyces lativittatus]KAJ1514062.1 37S ribosomal protein S24, mitochondrial [Coelomomyces lativittatus]KAJ1515330.1 37S ribosomal protein S24, mitochondrial [Coelomomyces lativittatus]